MKAIKINEFEDFIKVINKTEGKGILVLEEDAIKEEGIYNPVLYYNFDETIYYYITDLTFSNDDLRKRTLKEIVDNIKDKLEKDLESKGAVIYDIINGVVSYD